MRFSAIFVMFLSFWAFDSSSAQSQEDKHVFVWGLDVSAIDDLKKGSFVVLISDQVVDGCWLGKNEAKNAIKLELKRSNYNVIDSNRLMDYLVIFNVVGYSLNDYSCVVMYELSVEIPYFIDRESDGFSVSGLFYNDFWERSAVMSGPKKNMDSSLKDAAVNFIQEFLVEADEVRGEAFSKIVSSAKEYDKRESEIYWRSMLSRSSP